jgi:hypothetical protein
MRPRACRAPGPSALIISSLMPSQKYSWSRAALMSVNGITAIELSDAAAGDDEGVGEIGEARSSWATLSTSPRTTRR